MTRDEFNLKIDNILQAYPDIEYVYESTGHDFIQLCDRIYKVSTDSTDIEQLLINTINKSLYPGSNKQLDSKSKSLLQQYFDEVGYIYDKYDNQTEIEWCPENRDKLIEMNLKCVIKIAKGYRGMGLSLEELISAGNEGLCVAFDKYKPSKNKKREDLLNTLKTVKQVSMKWIRENIEPMCKYGSIKKKYRKFFVKESYTKAEVTKWITQNMKDASFNSVAMMWVQAYIRGELTNYSRLIKKPVLEIKKERSGEGTRETYLDINAPISDEGGNTLGDVLDLYEEQELEVEAADSREMMHDALKLMFTGIRTRDKRIVMQRFGIGLVRPMQPQEISDREQISVARISQIIQLTIKKMQKNAEKFGIDPNNLYQSIAAAKEIF